MPEISESFLKTLLVYGAGWGTLLLVAIKFWQELSKKYLVFDIVETKPLLPIGAKEKNLQLLFKGDKLLNPY